MSLTPEDVFTPSKAPLKESNIYVKRTEVENELSSSISQGQVPIIFGEFGVGKTSLALRAFETERDEKRLVQYSNPDGKSLDDVFRQCLEQFFATQSVSFEVSSMSAADVAAEAGIWTTFKASFGVTEGRNKSVRREMIVRSPTDEGILQILEECRAVIVIDELHRASDEFRSDLTRLIKSLGDRGRSFPKMVLVGTSAQAEQLVQADRGIDRLIREVQVRPLSEPESAEVVQRGFAKLGISLASDLENLLVSTAAGAPSLLHSLCLESALVCIGDMRNVLKDQDVDSAVQTVVKRKNKRLTARYSKAINTTGSKRYRSAILRVCAMSENDFISMEILVEGVSSAFGEPVSRTRLSTPLRELKKPEYGEILSDVPRVDGQGRHYNLTVFTDPEMKAYVRLLSNLQESGVSVTDEL